MVVVLCFWGGEILTLGNGDYKYSIFPRSHMMIPDNYNFEQLMEKIYTATECSPYDIKLKLRFKIPVTLHPICVYNVYEVKSDADVALMLHVPEIYYNGSGTVELYIEMEPIRRRRPVNFNESDSGSFGRLSTIPSYETNDDGFNVAGQTFASHAEGNSGTQHSHCAGESSHQTVANRTMQLSVCEPIDESESDSDFDLGLESDTSSYIDDDSDAEEETDVGVDGGEQEQRQMVTNEFSPSVPWYSTEQYQPTPLFEGASSSARRGSDEGLYVGQTFVDKNAFKQFLTSIHLKERRNFKVGRSSPQVFVADCLQSGCQWKIRASTSKRHSYFEIKKMPYEHTCMFANETQHHRKLSSRLIAEIAKPNLLEDPSFKVKAIAIDAREYYKFHVSYKRAWNAKQIALASIYGDWKKSFGELPMFFTTIVHYNPGSKVHIQVEQGINGSTFKRCWWAFKPAIDGWVHARPVISIDATFLKGKYEGKLLIAMGYDGNMEQFPLAYGIVDQESTLNWGWFLKCLRRYVCKDRHGVCIISDRHQGIIQAMSKEECGFYPPLGVHRFCMFHLQSNFASKYPGLILKNLMWLAATSHQRRKFDAYMNQIGELSKDGEKYLRDVPLEMWTFAFDGGYRYGVTTTNILECYNNNIRKARFLPIKAMVEYIFYKNVTMWDKKRVAVDALLRSGMTVCERPYKIYTRQTELATSHIVTNYDSLQGIFQVKTCRRRENEIWKGDNIQLVNLRTLECSCGRWVQYHFPCSHTIAASMAVSRDCSPWQDPYNTAVQHAKIWEGRFGPLPHEDYRNFPVLEKWQQYGVVRPNPEWRRKKGRPTARIHTEMDRSRIVLNKCSKCNTVGHTRRNKKCPMYNMV